jgi:hypothetical protein
MSDRRRQTGAARPLVDRDPLAKLLQFDFHLARQKKEKGPQLDRAFKVAVSGTIGFASAVW